jgi:hypothetical protein
MINSIGDYLKQLRKELAGCDRAIIQDALSDAGEHLKNSVENLLPIIRISKEGKRWRKSSKVTERRQK